MVQVPTRLPVGAPGQVLKVNEAGTDPRMGILWSQLDAVYYTAIEGVDSAVTAAGVTLDKPFKTVNFGLQQIENGARNPYAKELLFRNKGFVPRRSIKLGRYTGCKSQSFQVHLLTLRQTGVEI